MKLGKLAVALAATVAMGSAQAALIDRGGGMIYDNVLNITWLQDANYAKTSGYDADGKMNWYEAMTWAEGLVYGGYSDWRLPDVKPVNGEYFTGTYSHDGTTDIGYNINSTSSEMAYMHYSNLGNMGLVIPNGNFSGCQNNLPNMCMYNVGMFHTLQADTYWSMTGLASDSAFNFNMSTGGQSGSTKTGDNFYAWAVHDGDVSRVPAPPAFILMLTGLGILGLTKRFRKADKEA